MQNFGKTRRREWFYLSAYLPNEAGPIAAIPQGSPEGSIMNPTPHLGSPQAERLGNFEAPLHRYVSLQVPSEPSQD